MGPTCSGRQLSTKLSPTCISDSMARSFATDTVNPRGSKDACATQDVASQVEAESKN